jgi:aspartyl-tRNA(Asn)/glutamyl-tRNA(Gln) amidotransferase subunit A
MCPIALGSDTGGSIRQPASFCGIVGFKPTYGRVSRFGLVAFGSSLDQIGPLTTNVSDAALAMEVLGRHCERDSTSIAEGPEDLTSHLNESIAGKRIGVPWEYLKEFSGESRQKFEEALKVYRQLGAQIVEVDLSLIKYTLPAYYIIAPAEASTNLARFDGIRYGVRSKEAKTLREVYELSKEDGYGPEVKRRIMIGTYVLSAGFQDAYYRKAQKLRTLLIRQFQAAFKLCDVVSLPTTPGGAFKVGAIQDPVQMYLEDVFTIAQNLAGVPAISIPSGFTKEGKPLGFQIVGNLQRERDVFQMAYAFEQKSGLTALLPKLEEA